MRRRPVDHDKLKCRARAPEQRRRRQRDLAELVAPEKRTTVAELPNQEYRILARSSVIDAGVGNEEVEQSCDRIRADDDAYRSLRRRLDPRVDTRNVDRKQRARYRAADQQSAEKDAEYDR